MSRLRPNRSALGSIETTLKAAGRVTENQNKTARVNSTLEGRLMKVNVDLNDARESRRRAWACANAGAIRSTTGIEIADRWRRLLIAKASVGELVGKEKEIFTISDPTDLWVIAEIKERDIGAVKVGQDASFTRARLSE